MVRAYVDLPTDVPKQENVISNEERKRGREAGKAVGEAGLTEVKHSNSRRTSRRAEDIVSVPQRNRFHIFQTCLSMEPFSQSIFWD